MSLFKTNTTKNYSKQTCTNNVFGGRRKPKKISRQNKAITDRIIRDIKNLFGPCFGQGKYDCELVKSW